MDICTKILYVTLCSTSVPRFPRVVSQIAVNLLQYKCKYWNHNSLTGILAVVTATGIWIVAFNTCTCTVACKSWETKFDFIFPSSMHGTTSVVLAFTSFICKLVKAAVLTGYKVSNTEPFWGNKKEKGSELACTVHMQKHVAFVAFIMHSWMWCLHLICLLNPCQPIIWWPLQVHDLDMIIELMVNAPLPAALGIIYQHQYL